MAFLILFFALVYRAVVIDEAAADSIVSCYKVLVTENQWKAFVCWKIGNV